MAEVNREPGRRPKTVRVRQHDRTIRSKIYHFICEKCNRGVRRETYSPRCPLYCHDCGNGKSTAISEEYTTKKTRQPLTIVQTREVAEVVVSR